MDRVLCGGLSGGNSGVADDFLSADLVTVAVAFAAPVEAAPDADGSDMQLRGQSRPRMQGLDVHREHQITKGLGPKEGMQKTVFERSIHQKLPTLLLPEN